VVDDANILSPQVEADLTTKLENLEKTTGRQLVVATVPEPAGLRDRGLRLPAGPDLGHRREGDQHRRPADRRPTERKVRIEVGYGLEPILTDALSSVIIQTAILPKFKAGDLEGGVVAGTDAIIAQLALPDEEAKANRQAFKARGGRARPAPRRSWP
jgi:uncharacterized protein